MRRVAGECGLDMLQLHGDESPEYCAGLRRDFKIIKSFKIKDASSLEDVNNYDDVDFYLFDTYVKGIPGGTGKSFDWELAVRGKELGIPIILAGGLTPSNIQRAISTVRPYAVDVNSGIEDSPGKKSPILMKKLMENIRGILPET